MSASGAPQALNRQIPGPVTLFRKQPPTDCMEATHEPGTWKLWLEAHGPKLLLCARQWTRSLADAEDVVQEAFGRLHAQFTQ
ncbi:MAG TPA: sigma factor, partial [Lacunisphaera sp.]|nr:sigma factor [Lacunisphaera sp.]